MRSTLVLAAAVFALVNAEKNVRSLRTSAVANDNNPLLVVESDNLIAEDSAYFGRFLDYHSSMPEVRKA
jgi:hypothetical protein